MRLAVAVAAMRRGWSTDPKARPNAADFRKLVAEMKADYTAHEAEWRRLLPTEITL